jgi:microcystin-dependent protein
MSEPYLGEIRSFAFDHRLKGWAECDGSSLKVADNQALYGLIGNAYGGDDVSFRLPDLRGRVPVGKGQLHGGEFPGEDYVLGAKGGSEKVFLTAKELPPHRHNWAVTSVRANAPGPGAGTNYLGDASFRGTPAPLYASPERGTKVKLAGNCIGTGDGGQGPHENMQPFQTTGYWICINGIYPSRG